MVEEIADGTFGKVLVLIKAWTVLCINIACVKKDANGNTNFIVFSSYI